MSYMEDNKGVEVLVCLEDRDRILFLEIQSLFGHLDLRASVSLN